MSKRIFIAEANVINKVTIEFKKLWKDAAPLIICDRNTWGVAGKIIYESFINEGFYPHKYIFLENDLSPTMDNVQKLKTFLLQNGGIAIAVGSGTINDLVKRASAEINKEYMVFPTAPSVDGYTAYGAALIVNGFKTTMPCDPPVLVVADTEIIKNAPLEMISAGYGDLSAKITAGADWKIASILNIESINTEVWDMVQNSLRVRLSHPDLLQKRDGETIINFFKGLVEVGYAMQIYKDSRPASGAEHLMSHVWEMENLSVNNRHVSHGFKVSIGTLATTAMMMELENYNYNNLIKLDGVARTWEEREKEIKYYFDDSLPSYKNIKDASYLKFIEGKKLIERRESYKNKIGEINKAIKIQIFSFKDLQEKYKLAGCPYEPEMIGLSKEQFALGIRRAQYIRKRYTILDLLYETGIIDDVINTLVYSDKYFTKFK